VNILITGANGFIGKHLVSALTKRGHQVFAGVHNIEAYKEHDPTIKIISCDFNQLTSADQWRLKLENIDVVINTVGIIKETATQKFKILHTDAVIALFKACEQSAVKKVIQISALGADNNALSEFHRSKKLADDFLVTLNLNSVIVMPSIVYSTNSKSMSLFKTMAALPVTPVMNNGVQKIQPIHIDDFTRAIVKIVSSNKITRIKISFVGSEAITMKNLFILLKQWLNSGTSVFINIPYSITYLLSKIIGLYSQSSITTESVQMLEQGNTADVTPFVSIFGFVPIGITEFFNRSPAQQSEQKHINLVLLRPVLRLSIAFLWIFTAISTIFFYPLESSYSLLAMLGLTGGIATILLYSAAVMDMFLGLATLFAIRLKIIGIIQIIVILSYTLLITIFIPEQWLHPFGAISKNIPIIIATLVMISFYDHKQV